jgi:biotin transport system substrate-specific component
MILENSNKTLYELFFPFRNLLLDIFMIGVSVAFLGVMANLSVPLWPVPITMQTFGVFLIAFFFGSKKGVVAILGYIATGILGLGVFAAHKSGISAVFGPTFGYLLGFIFMVLLVGILIEKGYGRTWKSVLICMIIGEAVLYLCGITGLWLYLGNASLLKVLQLGFLPFIIGDILKVGAAVALFPYFWKGEEKIKA